MDPKENGARPAFQPSGDNAFALGLTKREHFAAMAMQGMLSDESEDCGGVWKPDDCAKRACEFADALLRALAAGGEG